MSPRARRGEALLTGAALRRAIREEIERQVKKSPQPLQDDQGAALNTITGFPCPDCRLVMVGMPDYLAHDVAVHLDGRTALADARLRERKGRA